MGPYGSPLTPHACRLPTPVGRRPRMAYTDLRTYATAGFSMKDTIELCHGYGVLRRNSGMRSCKKKDDEEKIVFPEPWSTADPACNTHRWSGECLRLGLVSLWLNPMRDQWCGIRTKPSAWHFHGPADGSSNDFKPYSN
jgi:hypothetical protein